MRDGGDLEGIWTIMESGMELMAVLQHFPWFMPLFRLIPFGKSKIKQFREFSWARVRARKEKGSVTKDLFYHLVRCFFPPHSLCHLY